MTTTRQSNTEPHSQELERAVHPAAALFPMLEDDELRALADDIKANGLRQPIVLTAEGAVLDGRNRLAACELAGVEPEFTTYDGDPATFVLSANVHRRHMSTGARAMATAKLLADAGLRQNGRWVRGVVPAANGEISNTAWAKAMTLAGELLDVAPERAEAVIRDVSSLTHELADARGVSEREARYRAEVRVQALDFADGDEALADRIVTAYVNLGPNDRCLDVGDIAEALDYFELSRKDRRAFDKARRDQQRAEREAAEAVTQAEWDALPDEEKQAQEAAKRERARSSLVKLNRLMTGEVDPEAEIRNLIGAINSTIGQLDHAYNRLEVHTGLPAGELRAEITAKLVERKMPEAAVELLWLLLDDEPSP